VRMERILAADPFYRRLGANGFERVKHSPLFTHVALRVYIARLAGQIAKAAREAGSMLTSDDVLVSETTDLNVVVHRINLPVGVIHRPTKR
jgi:hypothetical protein